MSAQFLTHSNPTLLQKEVAMTENFREMPIVLGINPFTHLIEGDDTGYRKVAVSPLDAVDPDPLVFVRDQNILEHPVYHGGATQFICPYYPSGIGGYPNILVREPVLKGLIEVNKVLQDYNRRLVVLDGVRLSSVQRNLWENLFFFAARKSGIDQESMTVTQTITLGMEADAIGSYCDVDRTDRFYEMRNELLGGRSVEEFYSLAISLKMEVHEVVDLYLCFSANRGVHGLELNIDAPTAHGSGGAVDLWMIDTEMDTPCFFGAPFDYMAPKGLPVSPTAIDYFERPDVTPETYRETLEADTVLRDHVIAHGFSGKMQDAFHIAREERRILTNAMELCNASIYNGEFWHFQLGNELGGRQKGDLWGSGNTCHALLKGKPEAVWSNKVAHELACELMSR